MKNKPNIQTPVSLTDGGTGADLSATGGTGQFLKQTTTGGAISVGALGTGDIPSGIDATKIGSGNVSNTEFGYLDGVTSSIQGQLNGKVGGSGSSNRLAFWFGTNALSYDSSVYLSGSTLNTGNLNTGTMSASTVYGGIVTSTGGSFSSLTGKTHLPTLRNQAFSAALYWDSSTKEVGYLFSRAAHKKNIKTIESSMDELMKWRPVTFEWKEAFGGKPDLGLISEEVEAVFPLAASYDQDWEYTDEETGEYVRDEDHMPKKVEGTWVPAGVKYERAWLPMLAAVQDFYRKYQELEKKVEKLEAQVGKQK